MKRADVLDLVVSRTEAVDYYKRFMASLAEVETENKSTYKAVLPDDVAFCSFVHAVCLVSLHTPDLSTVRRHAIHTMIAHRSLAAGRFVVALDAYLNEAGEEFHRIVDVLTNRTTERMLRLELEPDEVAMLAELEAGAARGAAI